MDKQFNSCDQFTDKLNCRLKHHHTEPFKEIKEVLSSMAQQVEVRNCSQHLDGVVSDMFRTKVSVCLHWPMPQLKTVQLRANQHFASGNACGTQCMMGWQKGPCLHPMTLPFQGVWNTYSWGNVLLSYSSLPLAGRRTARTCYCTWRSAKIFCLLIHWLIVSWW